jgi:hypothetical protein
MRLESVLASVQYVYWSVYRAYVKLNHAVNANEIRFDNKFHDTILTKLI